MPAIRAFLPSDVTAVAELRPLAFRYTHWPNTEQSAAYFHRMFFENPWYDAALPSLVYQTGGRIAGFLGILPRTFRIGGRLICAGVPTQYMVHPAHRGFAGSLLIRAALAGPQDLLIADVPNRRSQTMWEALGGKIAPQYGRFWSRPVRFPGRVGTAVASALSGHRLRRPRVFLSRMIYRDAPRRDLMLDPIESTAITRALLAIAGEELLHPVYDRVSFEWLMTQTARKWPDHTVHAAIVRDLHGEVFGWFTYILGKNAHAEVLQAVARRENGGQLVEALLNHARTAGAVRLSGRLEPRLAHTLVRARCSVQQTSPGLLVHSRDRELLEHVLHGSPVLTGLEGESWMMF